MGYTTGFYLRKPLAKRPDSKTNQCLIVTIPFLVMLSLETC